MARQRRTATAERSRSPDAVRRPKAVVYPESDGKPMAETELHAAEIMRLILLLVYFYRNAPLIYVWGNLLLYWEEGNNRKSVAPDVFVVKGVPKTPPRRYYQLWVEQVAPCFVIEVTSPKTRREDAGRRSELYRQLGVAEYWQYDPLGEWLRPPLQGYRLEAGEYVPVPAAEGGLRSAELGLRLVLEEGGLQLYEQATGERLLTEAEAQTVARRQAEARAQAEAERAQAEAEARRQAEARAQAEAEGRRAVETRLAELEARLRERRPEEPEERE